MQTFFLKLMVANKTHITKGWYTAYTVDFISVPFSVNCYKWKWETSPKNGPKYVISIRCIYCAYKWMAVLMALSKPLNEVRIMHSIWFSKSLLNGLYFYHSSKQLLSKCCLSKSEYLGSAIRTQKLQCQCVWL